MPSKPDEWRARMDLAYKRIDAGLKKAGGAQVSTAEMQRLLDRNLGPSVTVTKTKGKNPHVGLKLPKTSNEEVVKRRRARRKKKAGKVRAVNRRK